MLSSLHSFAARTWQLVFLSVYVARIIPIEFLCRKIQRQKERYQSSNAFSKVGRQEIKQSWTDRPRTFEMVSSSFLWAFLMVIGRREMLSAPYIDSSRVAKHADQKRLSALLPKLNRGETWMGYGRTRTHTREQ
jgi:hypothetical protein